MNDLQKVQLSILKEFDRVCELHNIPYSLGCGTLIGAIRHKGFIPWDDDVDVFIMRRDFEKLESVWLESANQNIFLQTYKSDFYYPYPFAKIRDKGTTFVESGNEHLDIVHGIFIDVFLVDYTPSNKRQRLFQLLYAEMVWILTRKYVPGSGRNGFIRKCMCAPFIKGLRTSFLKIFERQIGKYGYEEASHISFLNFGWKISGLILPKDMFFELEKVAFEDDIFLVMKEYDKVLTSIYGNYMDLPPEDQRTGGHGYVVLDTQKPYTEVLKNP